MPARMRAKPGACFIACAICAGNAAMSAASRACGVRISALSKCCMGRIVSASCATRFWRGLHVPTGDVQLRIDGVAKQFGGVTAVDDVSIEVRRGEILSIIGPNGAGKTSLLNMVSGFYRPDRGRIVFEGEDITELPPSRVAERGIARTFQNIALFRGMTVLDNLMLGRHVRMRAGVFASFVFWGLAQREEIAHREKVEDLIEFLKLEDLRKQPTGALSYGLQKRVELGRALAAEPKLLLLDEPMAGMNQEEKEDMARYVLDVNEERGTTIVLIEHDMGVVMDISRRVVVLDRGRVIAEGEPRSVQADPAGIRAYLGTKAHAKAA